jgi:cystathionine beta-lyase/cystathionine gamma-synthase
MKFSTKVIHSGKKFYSKLRPILTPIYQTTTYVQESVEKYDATGYTYSRKSNPTRTALEDRINELEGGKGTCVFSMGMAAINITAQTLLEKGDHVIVSDVVYGGTPRLFNHIFKKFGVEFDYVDTAESQNVKEAIKENTRMVFTETPANPTLKLTDLKAVSSITNRTNRNKLLHVVDNTFLTPYYQRPLELYRCQGKLSELCCGSVMSGEGRGWRGVRESSSKARSTTFTTDSLEGKACSATRKRRLNSSNGFAKSRRAMDLSCSLGLC